MGNIQTMTLWQNPRNGLWINYVNKWLIWKTDEHRINDVMAEAEEAMKKWCHGKVLEISQKWCHWESWRKEPLIIWCNVLWGTNKWLIRDFPKDLGIKRLILATQISSLFDSELRTPSLVYAIIWFSHWKIEALPRSILRLGRNAVSAVASIVGYTRGSQTFGAMEPMKRLNIIYGAPQQISKNKNKKTE